MAFVIETYRFTTICRSIVMIFALITLSSISQRFNRIHVKINKMMPTSVTRIVNVVVWKSAAKILSTYLWNFRLGQSIQQSHFAISWSFKLKSSWAKTFQQIEFTDEKNIVAQCGCSCIWFESEVREKGRERTFILLNGHKRNCISKTSQHFRLCTLAELANGWLCEWETDRNGCVLFPQSWRLNS